VNFEATDNTSKNPCDLNCNILKKWHPIMQSFPRLSRINDQSILKVFIIMGELDSEL
jgi:hypothetical protein